jgi:hypothetical protein
MTTTEATPGQAAYEAWRHAVTPADKPLLWLIEAWHGGLDDEQRAGWDAAAQAAARPALAECARLIAELSACRQNNAAIAVQLDQYRDERDEAREQRDRLRQLATQVLAAYESGTVVSGELAGIWRETLEADGG